MRIWKVVFIMMSSAGTLVWVLCDIIWLCSCINEMDTVTAGQGLFLVLITLPQLWLNEDSMRIMSLLLENYTVSFVLFFFFTQAADLVIQLSSTPKARTDVYSFGTVFTDHMLTIEWSEAEGWQAPLIKPFGNLSLHPACSSLHYGVQVWPLGCAICLKFDSADLTQHTVKITF